MHRKAKQLTLSRPAYWLCMTKLCGGNKSANHRPACLANWDARDSRVLVIGYRAVRPGAVIVAVTGMEALPSAFVATICKL